ncbi:MAG: hypothetical protein J5737_04510 [Bacteroidales bacterium]|nr:hypothetical protein [Bacteroidales bacterium]
MKHPILISVICTLGLLAAGGCVHEVPEGGDENASVALTLNLAIDRDVPENRTVVYESKAASAPSSRYLIRLFPYLGGKFITVTPYEFSFTAEELSSRTFTVDVPPMNYHVEVWADHISDGNPYYNADDFGAISVGLDPYAGGSELRDAFCGEADIDLSVYHENRSAHSTDIALRRPIARFTFVATDKERFFKRVAEFRAKKSDAGESGHITAGDFRIRIIYPQFMPSVYSLHNGRNVDSATGVSFWASMTELPDGNVNIGWDWVFASDDKASVVVSLALYDKDESFISRIDNIMIPLSPGKNTTVTGKLLSSGMDSGISIDPSFEGEFTVILN